MRDDGLRRAGLALAAALALSASAGAGTPAPTCAASYDARILAPGDIVFIAVDDALWARIAAATSTRAHRFGHVGIAVRTEAGDMGIVHARGSPTADNARVVVEAPQSFWREADRVGVYRPRQPPVATAIAGSGARFAGVPFDRNFSLESADALYCTELIWRAMSTALGDAAPEVETVAGREAITLAALETHTSLREVAFWRADCAEG